MFNEDHKIIQRMTPMLQRAVIVDPQAANTRLISELMRNIARSQVWTAQTTAKGLQTVAGVDAQIVFVEMSGAGVDGAEFTRQLRRSNLACRQAPVIMTAAAATAAGIMAARDSGVHEFLRRPFTMRDLLRRLEAVTLHPRDWIEAVGYIGPDRRRFNSGDYAGPLKRRSDARETPASARIAQALKILQASVTAVETDPEQALRSIRAQTAELQKSAVAAANMDLTTATAAFNRWLATAAAAGPLTAAETQAQAAPLLAFLPKDDKDDAAGQAAA